MTMVFFILSIPIMAVMVALAAVPLVLVSHADHKVRTRSAVEHEGTARHAAGAHASQRDAGRAARVSSTPPMPSRPSVEQEKVELLATTSY
jgi:hypothetical protein